MDITRARELLVGLADGVNPLTGEILPDDSVYNQAEIVRALNTVLNALPKSAKSDKPLPANAGKPWTEENDDELSRLYDAGSSKKDICEHFQRTDGAIAARLVRIGKIHDRDEFRKK